MRQTSLASSPIQVLADHGFAEIRQNTKTKQKSLHATLSFKKGEQLCSFSAGEICSQPHYLTVQTGNGQHITLDPLFLQYINHSCSPNVFFNTTTMALVALRDITENEEFTFFYPSTEWDMAQPFYCYCESTDCLQNIKGARYLTADQVKRYELTDFIKQQLKHTNH